MDYKVPPIQLPAIDWQLKKYPLMDFPSPQTIKHFSDLTEELNRMEQSMGKNDRLDRRKLELLGHLGNEDDLIHEVQGDLDIRAIISLWLEIDAFIEQIPVSQPILMRFHQVRVKMGLLALHGLIQLFIERFDQCGDVQSLAQFIREAIKERTLYSDDLKRLQKQANAVLSPLGPKKIVDFAIKNNRELKDIMRLVGIPEEQSGRYIDVCHQCYYIETLKQLEPGDQSDIFDELVQNEVTRMPYNNNWLGHEVLSIMIQKGIDSGIELPEYWRDIILSIAGDPRKRGQTYRKWWNPLSLRHIEAMQGWMAGLDLKLFLESLMNYANSSGNTALERMFRARVKFLQGLYDHGLIASSKLFIGENPGNYLKSQYHENQMPMFSKLNDRELSVIYLKLQVNHHHKSGYIHMVEGSHNFALRIYKDLPDKHPFSFESRPEGYRARELRTDLENQYMRQYNQSVFSVSHDPYLHWLNKLLQELKEQGVLIEPEWVLSTEDYSHYKDKFGI